MSNTGGRPNWRNGGKPSSAAAIKNESSSTELVVKNNAITPPAAFDTSFISDAVDFEGKLDPKSSTYLLFFDITNEFAAACSDVWPNDSTLKEKSLQLKFLATKDLKTKLLEGRDMSLSFVSKYERYFGKIIEKDEALFDMNDEFMSLFEAREKFSMCSEEVKSTIWEYLRSLVQYANMAKMYEKCPQSMLKSIAGMAGGIMSKIKRGEMDAEHMNPLEIGSLIMKDLNTDDLEAFGSALMSDGNLEGMINIMQSSMSTMGGASGMAGMAGMGGIGGGPGGAMGGGLGGLGAMLNPEMMASLFRKQ